LWWEWVAALASAVAAVAGSSWVIRLVVRHEEQECDARLQAFKNGLDREK
jgi:hypothetical protein